MKARTTVEIADVWPKENGVIRGDLVGIQLVFDNSGSHRVILVVSGERSKRCESIELEPQDWEAFKSAVESTDRTIADLAGKGLIYDPVAPVVPPAKELGPWWTYFPGAKPPDGQGEQGTQSDPASNAQPTPPAFPAPPQ